MKNAMPKSEIIPIFEASDDSVQHSCAFEFVPNSKRPREIYVVFDGQRIATRGVCLATGEPGWLPLIEGYEVTDEAFNAISVFFGSKRLH